MMQVAVTKLLVGSGEQISVPGLETVKFPVFSIVNLLQIAYLVHFHQLFIRKRHFLKYHFSSCQKK